MNLPLSTKPAQRWSHWLHHDLEPMNALAAPKNLSFALLAKRPGKPMRIPPPIISARPVLRGDRHYLRALRAAEVAVWNAGIKPPAMSTSVRKIL